jgi:hypothetical protein
LPIGGGSTDRQLPLAVAHTMRRASANAPQRAGAAQRKLAMRTSVLRALISSSSSLAKQSSGGTLTRFVPLDFTSAVAAIRAEITEIDERLKGVNGLTARLMAQLTALDGVMPTSTK